jgi:hypothetical protein
MGRDSLAGSITGSSERDAETGRGTGAVRAGRRGGRLRQTRAVRTIWSFSLSGASRTQVRGSIR